MGWGIGRFKEWYNSLWKPEASRNIWLGQWTDASNRRSRFWQEPTEASFWCHTCSGTQPSLVMGWIQKIHKQGSPAPRRPLLTVSGACPWGGLVQKVLALQCVTGWHEDWASSPGAPRTRRQGMGTAGRCESTCIPPSPAFALGRWKRSSYIWGRNCHHSSYSPARRPLLEEFKYQQVFHLESAQTCQLRSEGAHTCSEDSPSVALGYMRFCSRRGDAWEMPVPHETWS